MINLRHRGFTLVEFVVAIVFIGVVLAPLLLYAARLQEFNHAVGRQARREAWNTFNEQAITLGIDPNSARALNRAENRAIPEVAPTAVTEGAAPAQPGLPRILPLRAMPDAERVERRILAAGFQVGAGGSLPPRSKPVAPLPPVVMPAPLVKPNDGARIAISDLQPVTGQSSTLIIEASAAAGARVQGRLNQPFAAGSGSGRVEFIVTAADLLNRVSGTAWTEFPGNISAGDREFTLPDGRTRWLVMTAEHRLQIYEPSLPVLFGYQIDLGAPVLVRDSTEFLSGARVAFDYAGFQSISRRGADLRIDFPSGTKSAVGPSWATAAIGFQWTFGGQAGPFSGEARTFFSDDALPLWTDEVPVSATPVLPAGAVASNGAWTLQRTKLALGVPVLTSRADGSGFYSPGQFQFSVPTRPDGTTVGRLSFDNGAALSTGTTLSIAVIP